MKFKSIIIYTALLCLLTGCGEKVGTASYPSQPEEVIDALAEVEEDTTEEPVTEPATEPVTALTVPHEDVQLLVDETIEVHSVMTLEDLFLYENVELEKGDELIDTSVVGLNEITINYYYEEQLYEQTVEYTVRDTTEPVVLNSGGQAYVERGEVFDLDKLVGYADNSDATPTLTYTGTVDTSVCGTYPVYATVTDASGNHVSWNVNVKVVEEIPEPVDDNARKSFESFTMEYGGENTAFGIDVSKWQGDIDFQAVKNAGCSFVIMRIGTYYDEYALDQYFAANMAGAKAAGLDVGVYIYTTANTEEEVRDNARWISSQLGGESLDFPVVFDWESFGNFQQYEMSINDLNCYFEAFADEMEKEGYSAMLYSSKNFLNNFWYEHKEYPIWLAHYTSETDYAGEYDMWQMTCYGRIDGIAADVDFNVLYTDRELDY